MKEIFENVTQKVAQDAVKNGLIKSSDKILVALSGGADSVYLLLGLHFLRHKLGITVKAAHLNHGIRGSEADRDELFSMQLCKENGIEFISERADVPSEMKKTGEGMEECARRIRYAFLENAAKKLECNKIATAHHADDNIETVLMHMIRGCGTGGLVGIRAVRGNIIRPLLGIAKADIIRALDDLDQRYMYDSTNSETDMRRNYIRENILPHIYKLNPEADEAFFRMCSSVAEDKEFIDGKADELRDRMDINELRKLPSAMLTRYIVKKHAQCFSEAERPMLEKEHIDAIKNDIVNYKSPKKRSVSGGAVAYVDSEGIVFETTGDHEISDDIWELKMGENIISPIGYRILITMDKKVAQAWKNIYKLSILMSLNSDKIINKGKCDISVRTRRSGDGYVFAGHRRVLKKQFIDRKIPQRKRDTIPCFLSGGQMFWVYGLPIHDDYKYKPGDAPLYIVCAECADNN